MKKNLLLVILIGVLFVSCNKSGAEEDALLMNGNWRMIAVKDNMSGTLTRKSPDLPGNVDITFQSAGTAGGVYSGHTPSNDIYESSYFTGANHSLTINQIDMTKVAENAWGLAFVDHICKSKKYAIRNGNMLDIITTAKTLSFSKR